MLDKLRKKFTEWYIDQGYATMKSRLNHDIIFLCPWWVKPFTWLWSPSIAQVYLVDLALVNMMREKLKEE